MPQNKRKTLVLIDSNALVHRAFHALPATLRNRKGQLTNAVYGFTTMFLSAVKELNPDYVIAAFDVKKKTFRHEEYHEYKAKRVAAPDELYEQIPIVVEVLNAFEVPVFTKEGYEADDIVGTLAREGEKKNLDIVVVTGDLDTLQLVDPNVKIYTLKRGFSDTVIYDEKGVMKKLGLTPEQVIDYKALRGDQSDNIPGVKGIGEKTAADLLKQFSTLTNLLNAAKKKDPKIPEKLRTKLVRGEKDALMSHHLAEIVTNLPLNLDLKHAKFGTYDPYSVLNLFQELGFRSLVDKIPKLEPQKLSLFETFVETRHVASLQSKFKCDIVDTKEKLDKLIDHLKKQKEFVIDLETTGLDALEAKLVGISIAWEKNIGFYIPFGHLKGKQIDQQIIFAKLRPLVESETIGKIGHHLKYDLMVWENNFPASKFGKISFDTLLAAYLLDPDSRQTNLDDLTFLELGYRMQPIEELIGAGKKQLSFAEVPIEKAAFYSGEDAVFTCQLKEKLEKKLRDVHETKTFKTFLEHYHLTYQLHLTAFPLDKLTSPWDILRKMEIPLIPVLASMEEAGIKLNSQALSTLSKKVAGKIEQLTTKIYKLGGGKFNVRSPQQLKEVLFEKLKIDTTDIKKTKTGFSTAASEMVKLKKLHPIIKLISEHRELSKLKSTYLDTLPKLISKKTGRLHTSYNQAIAATGRLTSSNPNLQNIPTRTTIGEEIRKAFEAKEGCKLLSADYSQIELRVVACIAKETEMLRHFAAKRDIHTATAMKIFKVKEQDVTKAMRRQAKIVNFGILYGVSAFGLAQQTDMDRHKAKEVIVNYFQAFPKIKAYVETIKKLAQKQGYVETIFGRRRYLANINSSIPMLRNASERTAINMPIQGSAADIIKLAMIELNYQLHQQKLQTKLLLQVHDELLLEVPEKELNKVTKLVKKVMEGVVTACVSFDVGLKVGENWSEMKEL